MLNGANRDAVLHRIDDAKEPDTRARRIAQYVATLHRHGTYAGAARSERLSGENAGEQMF